MTSVQVGVLGPLECRVDDRAVSIPSRKHRAILAVLAVHAPEAVSADRLILALWGDEPPASGRNSLEAHISRLRKVLGAAGAPADVLCTQPAGYVLAAGTDLERFRRLRAAAVASVASDATDRGLQEMAAGLALWRGAPLGDLVDEPFAALEIARLE